MIKDIEDKKINMVITKDMSRLGRDYIETGNLVEKYFPKNNIRYISVTDNIDTYLDSGENDIAPFKAIMNDMYAKDISKKIRSSLRAKMKEGKFVGARAPYGYKKDPKNKNHLIINRSQSLIVKRIYKMFLEGLTPYKIAKELTDKQIKAPAEYYNFKWKNKINNNIWNSKTVKDILTNRIYTGDLVQNKRNKINYKVNKIKNNNPKDYIIKENTHKKIIDKDTFNKVQSMLPKNIIRIDKKEHYLLDNLIYCAECGHRVSVTPRRKKDGNCYTICNYYRSNIKNRVCTPHSNNYDKLEKEIINTLKKTYLKYVDITKITQALGDIQNNKNNNIILKKQLLSEIDKIKDNLDNIYLDKLNNKIDEERYNRIKIKLENLLKEKENTYNKLINIKNKELNIDYYLSKEYISRNLIIRLIEKIEISKDKEINIKFTFNLRNKI